MACVKTIGHIGGCTPIDLEEERTYADHLRASLEGLHREHLLRIREFHRVAARVLTEELRMRW